MATASPCEYTKYTVSRPLHCNSLRCPLCLQADLKPYWMPFLGATDLKQKGMYEERDVFFRYSSESSFSILQNENQACLTYISPTFPPDCAEEELNSDLYSVLTHLTRITNTTCHRIHVLFIASIFLYILFFRLGSITNLMHNSFILLKYVCYITILDMFRALTCPSSGGKIVISQHLVSSLSVQYSTVCRMRADCRAVCSHPV